MKHARTIKTQKYIFVRCLISIIAAPPHSFGETERRLVICIAFTVAAALRVGAVGDADVWINSFVNVDRFEKVNVLVLTT